MRSRANGSSQILGSFRAAHGSWNDIVSLERHLVHVAKHFVTFREHPMGFGWVSFA